jgi:membrane protein implicated in regulation of membrane protease activity
MLPAAAAAVQWERLQTLTLALLALLALLVLLAVVSRRWRARNHQQKREGCEQWNMAYAKRATKIPIVIVLAV